MDDFEQDKSNCVPLNEELDMIPSDLDNLPTLRNFTELKIGDKVYQKQFGVGEVRMLYNRDEIIVQFSNLRKRLSIFDGVCRIPEGYIECQSVRGSKVEVVCDGQSMSFAAFKKKNKAERIRLKKEQQLLRLEQKLTRRAK